MYLLSVIAVYIMTLQSGHIEHLLSFIVLFVLINPISYAFVQIFELNYNFSQGEYRNF